MFPNILRILILCATFPIASVVQNVRKAYRCVKNITSMLVAYPKVKMLTNSSNTRFVHAINPSALVQQSTLHSYNRVYYLVGVK